MLVKLVSLKKSFYLHLFILPFLVAANEFKANETATRAQALKVSKKFLL